MRYVKEALRFLSELFKFTFDVMNVCVVTYTFWNYVMPIILTNLNLVYNATTLLVAPSSVVFYI